MYVEKRIENLGDPIISDRLYEIAELVGLTNRKRGRPMDGILGE